MLGGKCVGCGASKDLHFHHKDPKQKSFTITNKNSYSLEKILPELQKCELRCVICHRNIHSPKHGTISMYRRRKCRCSSCVSAWGIKCKEWKKTHRMNKIAESNNRQFACL